MTEPTTGVPSRVIAWRIARQEPIAYLIALLTWTTFHSLPVLSGWLLKVVLDRVQGDEPAGAIWTVLAVLAGVEVGRWMVLVISAVQWHGVWVFWHTVPRLNMLRSLVAAPGPAAGRLPGAPGEAVSRFRDDTKHVALVADVWLDVTGAGVAAIGALLVMARVDVTVTLVALLPVVCALLLTRAMARRLKDLRLVEREATAAVTGFIGDTFAAITAIKAAGAEKAVEHRFDVLGRTRATAALRDQVATQVLQTLSGATGNLSTGLALLLLAPSLAAGEASVGDIGLFASSAIVLATVPRWIARLGAYQRQADVSVDRMARLLSPGADSRTLAQPVSTALRHGPGAFSPVVVRPDRLDDDRLERLEVRGLVVRHEDGTTVGPVDLTIAAGEVTVLTGPVGAGKTTVLRGLLGLVAVDGGEVRWNGRRIEDPSTVLVPPRTAYLPQVPRLFSETMAETILLGLEDEWLEEALHVACLQPDLARMGGFERRNCRRALPGQSQDVNRPECLRCGLGKSRRLNLRRRKVARAQQPLRLRHVFLGPYDHACPCRLNLQLGPLFPGQDGVQSLPDRRLFRLQLEGFAEQRLGLTRLVAQAARFLEQHFGNVWLVRQNTVVEGQRLVQSAGLLMRKPLAVERGQINRRHRIRPIAPADLPSRRREHRARPLPRGSPATCALTPRWVQKSALRSGTTGRTTGRAPHISG